MAERAARMGLEQALRLVRVEHQRFGHRVEQGRRETFEARARKRPAGVDAPGPAALDASHRVEAADVSDVCRF